MLPYTVVVCGPLLFSTGSIFISFLPCVQLFHRITCSQTQSAMQSSLPPVFPRLGPGPNVWSGGVSVPVVLAPCSSPSQVIVQGVVGPGPVGVRSYGTTTDGGFFRSPIQYVGNCESPECLIDGESLSIPSGMGILGITVYSSYVNLEAICFNPASVN